MNPSRALHGLRIGLLSTLSLAGTALASPTPQVSGTGFTPGELILYSPAVNGASSAGGAVVRIDPLSGTVAHLADFPGGSVQVGGAVCYDAYRDRLLFTGSTVLLDPLTLWSCDGLGNLTDLGVYGVTHGGFTAGAGGKVYTLETSPVQRLRYLDENDVLHTLQNASGTGAYSAPYWSIRAILYEPGRHALYVATMALNGWECGTPQAMNVHRLLLSADGTRVVGEDLCAPFIADPGGGNVPVGLSWMPDGRILVVMDTNSNAEQPRMQTLDPVTGVVSTFASNGYLFAAATNAGTFSEILGRAVILDTGTNVLRSFGPGETGEGTIITPSSQISRGGSNEVATLIEIPLDASGGLIGDYCTSKVSSSGCVPTMSTLGGPSASAGSGFFLNATQVESQKFGLLFYGQSGPAQTSFLGGTLCVATPIQRTSAQFSGGNPPCSGSFTFDFNAHIASGMDPGLGAGSVVHSQYWFRDPADAFGVGLTNAVTFTVAP